GGPRLTLSEVSDGHRGLAPALPLEQKAPGSCSLWYRPKPGPTQRTTPWEVRVVCRPKPDPAHSTTPARGRGERMATVSWGLSPVHPLEQMPRRCYALVCRPKARPRPTHHPVAVDGHWWSRLSPEFPAYFRPNAGD